MDYFLSSFCKQKTTSFIANARHGRTASDLPPTHRSWNATFLTHVMVCIKRSIYFFFRFSCTWFMRMIVSWKGRAKRVWLHAAPPRDSRRINQSIQLRSLSQSVKAYILTIAFSPISIHSRKSTTELVLLVWEDMAVRPQRRERHWYYRAHINCESNNSHCDSWHFSLEGAFRWEPHILYFIARPAITLFLHPQHTLYT
jgi:hypothetical protein